MKSLSAAIALLTFGAFAALADTGKEMQAEKTYSAAFEQMKKLLGTWVGEMDMGEGPVEMKVVYRLIAGGSTIEERIFPDTPMEMLTLYHDDSEGRLMLTHYCMLGNRPIMKLKSADEKSLSFDFDPSSDIDVDKEMHMHSTTIEFVDDDTIRQACLSYAEGKPQPCHPVELKRVKE